MDPDIANTDGLRFPADRLMDIGQLRSEFKRLRQGRRLSQVRVAKTLGITQAALSAWETGKNQSLRTHTLNEVIHLVDAWRADSNIVQIPPDRIRTAHRDRDKPAKKTIRSESGARAREKMVKAIKAKLEPEDPGADVLTDLSWKDLLNIYILSKYE